MTSLYSPDRSIVRANSVPDLSSGRKWHQLTSYPLDAVLYSSLSPLTDVLKRSGHLPSSAVSPPAPSCPAHLGPFTVMSYNLLANTHVTLEDYPTSSRAELDPYERCHKILRVLAKYRPSVLLAQELEGASTLWGPALSHVGYGGVVRFRRELPASELSGNVGSTIPPAASATIVASSSDSSFPPPGTPIFDADAESIAVFYDSHVFTPVAACVVEYASHPAPGVRAREQGGVAVLLRARAQDNGGDGEGDRYVCVVTTHIIFNPRRGDVKLAQLHTLLPGVHAWLRGLSAAGGKASVDALCDPAFVLHTPSSDSYRGPTETSQGSLRVCTGYGIGVVAPFPDGGETAPGSVPVTVVHVRRSDHGAAVEPPSAPPAPISVPGDLLSRTAFVLGGDFNSAADSALLALVTTGGYRIDSATDPPYALPDAAEQSAVSGGKGKASGAGAVEAGVVTRSGNAFSVRSLPPTIPSSLDGLGPGGSARPTALGSPVAPDVTGISPAPATAAEAASLAYEAMRSAGASYARSIANALAAVSASHPRLAAGILVGGGAAWPPVSTNAQVWGRMQGLQAHDTFGVATALQPAGEDYYFPPWDAAAVAAAAAAASEGGPRNKHNPAPKKNKAPAISVRDTGMLSFIPLTRADAAVSRPVAIPPESGGKPAVEWVKAQTREVAAAVKAAGGAAEAWDCYQAALSSSGALGEVCGKDKKDITCDVLQSIAPRRLHSPFGRLCSVYQHEHLPPASRFTSVSARGKATVDHLLYHPLSVADAAAAATATAAADADADAAVGAGADRVDAGVEAVARSLAAAQGFVPLLKCDAVLDFPEDELVLRNDIAFPNKYEGSDHLPLLASFSWMR